MMRRLGKSGLREVFVLLGGVALVVIYLAWATHLFTERPDWLAAWQAAKLDEGPTMICPRHAWR